MRDHHFDLLTPTEIEEELGAKYFYRQRVYRLAESGRIQTMRFRGQTCYVGSRILAELLKDLELKIKTRYPEIDSTKLRIFYDTVQGKRIVIDGLFGKGISVNTDKETEEDLLLKITHILEWEGGQEEAIELVASGNDAVETSNNDLPDESLTNASMAQVLPEEIVWVKVDTEIIDSVHVKSFILISLPSIAQFIGVRSDQFIEWLAKTTFSNFVLSAHYKQIQDTEISVPWKKGIIKGYTSLVPLEILPEMIVAFRQAGRTTEYPEKTQLLYEMAKSTLEAVGLAMSGDKDKAAEELARVGKGLGLTVADQIIGIFKQYESRDYQIQTNREFNSKVKEIGADYAITTGRLTFGITGRSAERWKLMGTAKRLPSKLRATSREVMRQLSPSDGVGMTFGEKHYIKKPVIEEAIKTGQQGKEFYERLKDVGLLDD